MVQFYFLFLNFVLVTLAHVAVFSGFASARSAPSATSARPASNATGSVVALERRSTVKMNVKWLSNKDTWWIFTRKYSHDITLIVDHYYTGNMKYTSRNFNPHCHEDGVWCVTHGDPLSQEMAIWYKGYDFQHPNMTIGCYVEGYERCRDSVAATGWENDDLGLEMTLKRYSIRSTRWLFTKEYVHYIDLEV
ncbi:hypothetical protein BGZ47_009225 [Haplosporangium gracile]|nr:hypothetical protein BGZ47_009225 [Haplosporangium gracile]